MTERDPATSHSINAKMAELGKRFLERTNNDLQTLEALLIRMRSDDSTALNEIASLAHKIRGTGGILGFNAISEHAGKLELDATANVGANNLAVRIGRLAQEVRSAQTAHVPGAQP